MDRFIYPVTLTPDPDDGGYVVRFIDLPEAITQGETVAEALHEATDCLEEAIANRVAMKMDIPSPSPLDKEWYGVSLTAYMAIRAALYQSMRTQHITEEELATRLHRSPDDIHQLFDLDIQPDLRELEDALSVMGQQVFVGVQTREVNPG